MYKIQLKRIYRVNQPVVYYYYYDFQTESCYTSEFIIEFKLLFKLEESDKKELNSFLTRELLNKGFICQQVINVAGNQDLEFNINLEAINKNINKIAIVTKCLHNKYCNKFLNYIEYNEPEPYCIECFKSKLESHCIECLKSKLESHCIECLKSKFLIEQKESNIIKILKKRN